MTQTEFPNSAYTVLARRYRPQRFEDVIGQQHIAKALKNAIAAGRVAHAYLFTGARGVGKTSMARILCKALNCPNAADGEPCNQCEICQSISAGKDVDVLEIDGASNRGIDDIRSLRANVTVKSMRTRFKMYIIDEVHMLTKEAFNALLKTLEEPPPNVKFIFCTTEPHKLPDTILSRCQRFDFAAMANEQIIDRLTSITAQEGMNVDPEAIELVARRAGGSMRDSQSLFDQLLAFSSDRITTADVNQLLGTAPDERLLDLSINLLTGQRNLVLAALESAFADGVQIGNLTDQMIAFFRDLMILASGADSVALSSISEGRRSHMHELAIRWGLSRIVSAMQILGDAKGKMSRASQSRPYLELALIRISLLEDLQSIAGLAKLLSDGKSDGLKAFVSSFNAHAASLPAPASPAITDQKKSPELTPALVVQSATASSVVPASPKPQQSSPTTATAAQPDPVQVVTTEEASSKKPLDSYEPQHILTQLIARSDDKLKSQLRSLHRCAIIGPNQLDFSFSRRYNFTKDYFESKPEILKRLQQTILDITGHQTHITFSLLSSSEDQLLQESQQKQAQLHNKDHIDPFATEVLEAFGARVTNKEPIKSRQV